LAPESQTSETTRCGLLCARQWRSAAASSVPDEELEEQPAGRAIHARHFDERRCANEIEDGSHGV